MIKSSWFYVKFKYNEKDVKHGGFWVNNPGSFKSGEMVIATPVCGPMSSSERVREGGRSRLQGEVGASARTPQWASSRAPDYQRANGDLTHTGLIQSNTD
ncbi:unnamed protein product [Pleuronectes platessa]|uniref:Uncharacterized protein n=1 Tax=Pleuronectes platessa TaxID=8262 RepID=A0A9N7UED8_PLEPL|nr:unnamed protein product [Pleuronectes platessa]